MFAADYPFRVDHDILVSLAADKCPGLAGRPKLVFVQVRERRDEREGREERSRWDVECFVCRRVKVKPRTRAAV